MKTKTSELTGIQLDWAVAKVEGHDAHYYNGIVRTTMKDVFGPEFSPSINWAIAGPIIEREAVNLIWTIGYPVKATIYKGGEVWIDSEGSTPLTAAMRCYVASKLGNEVEIPEELI